MAYQSSYNLNHNRSKKNIPQTTWLLVACLGILFIVAVFWFRSTGNKKSETGIVNSIANVFTPRPVDSSIVEGGINLTSKDASLIGVNSKQIVGQATRGTKDGKYFFEGKAILPTINRETNFYDVWLVQSVPYQFFSLGEMITNETGDFIIEWQPDDEIDLQAYTKIVVTLQTKGGDPDPQRHIVEGEFGK